MKEAPWFLSNTIIHEDLGIFYVTEEVVKLIAKYLLKFENHINHFSINPLDNSFISQRLLRLSIFFTNLPGFDCYVRFLLGVSNVHGQCL